MFHKRKHWLPKNLKMSGFLGFLIQSEIISELINYENENSLR